MSATYQVCIRCSLLLYIYLSISKGITFNKGIYTLFCANLLLIFLWKLVYFYIYFVYLCLYNFAFLYLLLSSHFTNFLLSYTNLLQKWLEPFYTFYLYFFCFSFCKFVSKKTWILWIYYRLFRQYSSCLKQYLEKIFLLLFNFCFYFWYFKQVLYYFLLFFAVLKQFCKF